MRFKKRLRVPAEGHPIVSALPQGVNETRIATMTAALLSLSERLIIEIKKGDFEQIYIKGSKGLLSITQAGLNVDLIEYITANLDTDDNNRGDNLSYPYIFTPPDPPGGSGVKAPQLQIKKSMNKEPENEIYCQYCGMKLTREERFSHNCGKKPK